MALALTTPASGVPESGGNRDIRGLWVDHLEGDQRKVAVWIEDYDGLLGGRIYWLKKPWSAGRIYNPNDGRTFRSTIHLEPDGSLVRGYVGFTLFGRAVGWVRPQETLARCG